MSNIEIILSISGIILTGVWAILKYVFKLGKMSERVNTMEDNFCGLAYRMDNAEKAINKHSESITKVNTFIETMFPSYIGLFSEKSSPRKLNERGRKMFDNIEGNKFLNDNKEMLFEAIDKLNPLTKLDIESGALQVLLENINSPAFNHIKDIVYEMPDIVLEDGRKYSITIGNICFILSIPLRDLYIKEHKNYGH